MTHAKNWALSTLAAILLSGCVSGPSTSVRLYQLSALPAKEATPTRIASVGVGPIQWPEYLDRRSLLIRVDANTLEANNGERWAEPLDLNFSRVLRENLAAGLPSTRMVAFPWNTSDKPEISIRVEVLRFDSDIHGVATLRARWRFVARQTGGTTTEELGEWHTKGRDASPAAAVAALSETLAAMAKEIEIALSKSQDR